MAYILISTHKTSEDAAPTNESEFYRVQIRLQLTWEWLQIISINRFIDARVNF